MRWLSFRRGDEVHPGVIHGGIHGDVCGDIRGDGEGVIDLAEEEKGWPSSWEGLLEAGLLDEICERWRRADWHVEPLPLSDIRYAPPVIRPSKIVALGRNYREHAEEQKAKPLERPLLFSKAPSCLLEHEGEIVIPDIEEQVDYEAEMAFVIGRSARKIAATQAARYIAGVTVMNDVSGRRAQFGDRQWFRGKSFDTFGPIGPWVMTLDEVGDPHALTIRCRVNGELCQESTTAKMIFNVWEILCYVSHQMTLLPGDVITTGTPSGVGVFRDPPLFLKPGDVVEVEVEGVATLQNRVVASS